MTTTDDTASRWADDRTVLRMTTPSLSHRRRVDDPPARRTAAAAGTAAGDRLLLAAAMRGDASAWDLLVQAHLPTVWAWSVAVAGLERAAATCELVWLRLAQDPPADPQTGLGHWLRVAVDTAAAGIPRTHDDAQQPERQCAQDGTFRYASATAILIARDARGEP